MGKENKMKTNDENTRNNEKFDYKTVKEIIKGTKGRRQKRVTDRLLRSVNILW